MDGKSRLEKLFFGDFNAPVEFFCSPPFAGASGIRLVRDLSSDAPYILEVKYITNWLEIMKELEEKYPSRGITVGDIYSMPAEEQEQIAQHNRAMFQKIREERLDLCDIRTLTFPLYHLGDSLYAKMVALIANFRAEGGFDTFADGTTVIFRCVVGDELWSLRIREPQKSAMQLSDLCLKIIEDAENGKLNETEYLKLLSKSPRPYSGTAFLGQ